MWSYAMRSCVTSRAFAAAPSRRRQGFALCVAALLWSAAALAAPRRIEDCEAIPAPLAYNECLAAFGPTRANRTPPQGYAPAAEPSPSRGASHATAGGGRRRLLGAVVSRGRAGRVHMEFTPRR
jgi:hypothetical protein